MQKHEGHETGDVFLLTSIKWKRTNASERNNGDEQLSDCCVFDSPGSIPWTLDWHIRDLCSARRKEKNHFQLAKLPIFTPEWKKNTHTRASLGNSCFFVCVFNFKWVKLISMDTVPPKYWYFSAKICSFFNHTGNKNINRCIVCLSGKTLLHFLVQQLVLFW